MTYKNRDEGANKTDPVLFEHFKEYFRAAEVCIEWIFLDLVVVEHEVGDAQRREQDNHQGQVHHKRVKKTAAGKKKKLMAVRKRNEAVN